MRKEASLKQWNQLYDAIEVFYQDKPWEKFEDLELFVLTLPQIKEEVYCSIMGYHKRCVGLSMYIGDSGREALAAIISEMPAITIEYLSFETGWLSVYFDSPELLSAYQEEKLEQLNRLDSVVPQLSVLEKHCFPDDPNQDEVVMMTQIIEALNEALAYFYQLGKVFDFDNYIFCYDVARKQHHRKKIDFQFKTYPPVLWKEEQLDSLRQLKRNEEAWAIDLCYINTGVVREEDNRTLRVKILVIENQDSEKLLCALVLEPADEMNMILEGLLTTFQKEGIPNQLFFRNPEVVAIISDLAECLNINFDFDEEMIMIDEFMDFINQEEPSKAYRN